MKTYKNLWDSFLSDENIRMAIRNSSKRKRKRRNVREIYENQEKYIPIIREYAKNFKNPKHTVKEIYDGVQRKKRIIIIPKYPEQIVHHMLVQTLMPMFKKGVYEHTYASISYRGGYKGMKAVKKWINKGGRDIKYCFKGDIRKYFESIPREILIEKLDRKIKDDKILSLLKEILKASDKGIPLGFYTSQWIANWYLEEFDHFIKEKLKVKYYARYMDDIVFFGSNKKKLHKVKNAVQEYLNRELNLNLKYNWQVFRFHYVGRKDGKDKGRMLDFMGYKFYRNRTTLRKSILKKARRKALRLKKKKKTVYVCKQMTAYMGWLDHTDTYNYYLKYIKPYVNFRELKRKISEYDKKKRKEMAA